MNLFAHITTPDTIVLASFFMLGLLTGIAVTWISVGLRSTKR